MSCQLWESWEHEDRTLKLFSYVGSWDWVLLTMDTEKRLKDEAVTSSGHGGVIERAGLNVGLLFMNLNIWHHLTTQDHPDPAEETNKMVCGRASKQAQGLEPEISDWLKMRSLQKQSYSRSLRRQNLTSALFDWELRGRQIPKLWFVCMFLRIFSQRMKCTAYIRTGQKKHEKEEHEKKKSS